MTPVSPDQKPVTGPATPAGGRASLWRWVRIAVTAALLTLVFLKLDLRELGRSLLAARLDALLLLVFLLWLQRYLAALRWWLLLRCNVPGLRLWDVIRVTFAADFAGQFLPGTVGVELLRIYGAGRVTGSTAAAVSSTLADRLLSIVGLAVLVLVSLALAPRAMDVEGPIRSAGWIVLGVSLTLMALAASRRARRTLLGAVARVAPRAVSSGAGRRAARLAESVDQYSARPATLAACTLLGVLFQFMRVLIYFAGALALGIEAPFAAFAVFIPVTIFLAMLPISISGFGVREAAFMYLFAAVAVPAEQAVALSLFVQFVHILCTIPGAWFCAAGAAPRRNEPTPDPADLCRGTPCPPEGAPR